MVLVRVFLGLLALGWLAFGVLCFTDPEFIRDAAGVSWISPTGLVDVRATYGGIQTAVAVALLAGAINPHLTRGVLMMYGLICAGLGSARLIAAVQTGEWSSYTRIGVGFELGCVLLVLILLHRARTVPQHK